MLFNSGADSLEYLSVNGLVQAVNHGIKNKDQQVSGHCTACLTGNYPVDLEWWTRQSEILYSSFIRKEKKLRMVWTSRMSWEK